MNAITPAALPAMRTCRSPMLVRTMVDAFRTASTRLTLRSDVLALIHDRIADASDDDALLATGSPEGLATSLLSFVLRLRAQAVLLPDSVALPRPESLLRRHVMNSEGSEHLRVFLRRRLTRLCAYDATDSEIDLITLRLEWVFCDLPFSRFRPCASSQMHAERQIYTWMIERGGPERVQEWLRQRWSIDWGAAGAGGVAALPSAFANCARGYAFFGRPRDAAANRQRMADESANRRMCDVVPFRLHGRR